MVETRSDPKSHFGFKASFIKFVFEFLDYFETHWKKASFIAECCHHFSLSPLFIHTLFNDLWQSWSWFCIIRTWKYWNVTGLFLFLLLEKEPTVMKRAAWLYSIIKSNKMWLASEGKNVKQRKKRWKTTILGSLLYKNDILSNNSVQAGLSLSERLNYYLLLAAFPRCSDPSGETLWRLF